MMLQILFLSYLYHTEMSYRSSQGRNAFPKTGIVGQMTTSW